MSEKAETILLMDKVFLEDCREDPRGVEVFNLNLIRDLAQLGYAMTVVAHPSWESVLSEGSEPGRIEVVPCKSAFGQLAGSMAAARRLKSRTFSVFLLANVANRLGPAMAILRSADVAPRCCLIAHREPSRRNIEAQKRWSTEVVAVNQKIAGHFERAGFDRVHVHYGVTDAASFHPPEKRERKAVVDFCVLGHLDSAWKGSDTAIAAFRRLPAAVRERSSLHLAAFHESPSFPESNIVAYEWMPYAEMSAFLRKMDVLLVPSRDEEVMRETFSQAIVQGMLTGLPVIASDLPILAEKLDDGGGLTFRTEDELSAAMAELAGDDALRQKVGACARQTALDRYVWRTDVFVDRFLFPGGLS